MKSWGHFLRHPICLGYFFAASLAGCIFPCDKGDGTCEEGEIALPLLDATSNQSVVVSIERASDKSVLVTCTWRAEQTPPAWVCDPTPDRTDAPSKAQWVDGIESAGFAYKQLGVEHTYVAHIEGVTQTDVTLVRRDQSAGEESCGCFTGVFELGVAPLESVGAHPVAP